MAKTVINESFGSFGDFNNSKGTDELLDIGGMETLLTETNNTLRTMGVDMEDPLVMRNIYRDESTANTYIDALAEGLKDDDMKNFKTLCHTLLDEINGRGPFANKATLMALTEDNNSAGFMPVSKLVFPMFRFTWPRLHVKEITTVVPMDAPEITRYFFKAFAKTSDNSIIPLPSYSPLGNGQAIGTMTQPKEIAVPSSVNLLESIGASNTNTHLEKNAMIVGWEAIDPNGDVVTDADSPSTIMLTIDPDGKFGVTR